MFEKTRNKTAIFRLTVFVLLLGAFWTVLIFFPDDLGGLKVGTDKINEVENRIAARKKINDFEGKSGLSFAGALKDVQNVVGESPVGGSPAGRETGIVLGDSTAADTTDAEKKVYYFQKRLTSSDILSVLDHDLTYEQIAQRGVRRWNLNTKSVNSKKIVDYSIQSRDLDTGSVYSRAIEDHSIQSRDLAKNIRIQGSFTVDGSAYFNSDLDVWGGITAGFFNGNTITAGDGTLTLNDNTLILTGDSQINQNLLTASAPTFAGLTLTGDLVLGANTLTTSNETVITHLNADFLDGQHGAYYLPAGNISGNLNYIAKFTPNGNSLGNSIIYDDGTNVGIGTTNPGAALEINGQVKITGGVPGANKILTSDINGLATWETAAASGANTALSNLANVAINTSLLPASDDAIDLGDNTHRWRDLYLGPASLHIGTSTSDEGTISYATGNNVLNFQSTGDIALQSASGNVGIGTTAPTNLLDVAGGMKIGAGYAGIGTTAPANGLLIQGNVGIGTTSPGSYKLYVNGDTYIAGALTSSGNIAALNFSGSSSNSNTGDQTLSGLNGAPNTSTYILQTADANLTNAQVLGALGNGLVKNTTTTGVLSIAAAGTDYIAGNVGATNQVAYFSGLGALAGSDNFWFDGTNVGIGTTAPNAALTVNGVMSLAESATAPDATSGYGKIYTGTPADSYTKLLLHFDGSGANFVDSESTPKTITAYVSAVQTSDKSVFGGESGYFPGNSYLTVPSSADFAMGTEDFSVDFRVNFSSFYAYQWLAGASTSLNFDIAYYNTNNLYVWLNGVSYIFSWTPTINTWYHVAVTRQGTSLRAFINGTAIGTTQTSSDNIGQYGYRIGMRGDGSYPINGYLDELRVSKGIARWTSAFTPPTFPYVSGGLYYKSSTGDVTILGGGSSGGTSSQWGTNGSNIYYNSGNVGIGTTAPDTFKLQVAGSVGPQTNVAYDLGDNTHRWRDLYLGPASLHIGTSTSDEGTISYATGNNVLNFQSTGDIALQSASGNVGIGTTAPTNLLDVAGGMKIGAGYAGIGTTAPTNGLLIQGNVGIGTTNPGAALDVNGAIRTTSISNTGGTNGMGMFLSADKAVDLMEYADDAAAQAAYVSNYLLGTDVLTGGTATADSYQGGYEVAKAADNSEATAWQSANSAFPHWWEYDFGAGVTKKIIKLRVLSQSDTGGTYFAGFTLYGSNNDSDWTSVYAGAGANGAGNSWQDFTFTNSTAYRYYKINFTGNYPLYGSQVIYIKELEMMDMPLQDYSEPTIKQEGSFSLKGLATNQTLNKTLTRTVAPALNLSGRDTINFDIRASRTGSNIKIGFHDSGGNTTEITPNIAQADTWQTVSWDISGVGNANKDVIDQIIITIVNADAANTFYIDNMHAPSNSATGDIVFTTSNAESLRIDENGYVGIGTATPANALDIGNGGGIRIASGTPGSTSMALYNNAGTLTWNGVALATGGSSISGTTNYIPIFTGAATLGNSAIYQISGNVGIGATAPGNKLAVSGGVGIGTTAPGSRFLSTKAPDGGLIVEGNVGIGTTNPGATLEVNGTLKVDSLTTGGSALYINGGVLSSSDVRLKENVQNFSSVLDKIAALQPVTFEWKKDGSADTGFIAQDIQKIFPELVGDLGGGQLGVYYSKFTPYLTKAIQEQQGQISGLATKNSQLEMQVSNLDLNISQTAQSTGDLQVAVNEKLSVISDKMAAIDSRLADGSAAFSNIKTQLADASAKLKESENNLATFENSTNDTLASMIETENMLTQKVLSHEDRIAALEAKMTTASISGGGEIPANVLTQDTQGNVILAGIFKAKDIQAETGSFKGMLIAGNITAKGVSSEGVVAGAYTVKTDEKSVKNDTIGSGEILEVKTDEDKDGIDDETGSDGKSAVIKNTAVKKDSKIFVTSRTMLDQPLVVTKIVSGESFTVEKKSPTNQNIDFDWWIIGNENVEQK